MKIEWLQTKIIVSFSFVNLNTLSFILSSFQTIVYTIIVMMKNMKCYRNIITKKLSYLKIQFIKLTPKKQNIGHNDDDSNKVKKLECGNTIQKKDQKGSQNDSDENLRIVAIRRIQSSWRYHLQFQKQKKKKMDEYMEFLLCKNISEEEQYDKKMLFQSSSLLIQCKWRIFQAVKYVENIKNQENKLKLQKEEEENLEQHINQEYIKLIQRIHAFRIQSAFQINCARNKLNELRNIKRQKCALHIQRIMRGVLTRKIYQNKQQQKLQQRQHLSR